MMTEEEDNTRDRSYFVPVKRIHMLFFTTLLCFRVEELKTKVQVLSQF